MKNINLLPRVPLERRIFIPVMTAIISVHVLVIVLLVIWIMNAGSSISNAQLEIDRLKAEIQAEAALRVPDPFTVDYEHFKSDITQIKERIRDWSPIMGLVAENLPWNARLTDVSAQSRDMLSVRLQFKDAALIPQYISLLQQNDDVQKVIVSSLVRSEFLPVVDSEESGLLTTGEEDQSEDKLDSFDRYIEQLQSTLDEPADEAEEALFNMKWWMERRAAMRQHGYALPEVSIEVPDETLGKWMAFGFSPDDIQNALKQLQDYKELSVTIPEDDQELPLITIYEVTLDIALTPLLTGEANS